MNPWAVHLDCRHTRTLFCSVGIQCEHLLSSSTVVSCFVRSLAPDQLFVSRTVRSRFKCAQFAHKHQSTRSCRPSKLRFAMRNLLAVSFNLELSFSVELMIFCPCRTAGMPSLVPMALMLKVWSARCRQLLSVDEALAYRGTQRDEVAVVHRCFWETCEQLCYLRVLTILEDFVSLVVVLVAS